jgi:hypothetical protein
VPDTTDLERLPPPETRDDLLRRNDVARRALDAVLAAITEDEMGDLRDGAGWATVDHMSHIAAWERMIVAHLTDGSDHEVAGVEADRFAAMTLDELNNVLYHRMRGRSIGEAFADYRDAHASILAFIRTMEPTRFAQPYWPDEPDGRTVMQKVAGDTYLHYLEHRRWILDLVHG